MFWIQKYQNFCDHFLNFHITNPTDFCLLLSLLHLFLREHVQQVFAGFGFHFIFLFWDNRYLFISDKHSIKVVHWLVNLFLVIAFDSIQ